MDIKKYIYGHCVHPKRVRIWDAYLGTYQVRELPCGKCIHCRNTRVNEWVTRLYAEQKSVKNTYFVTLDYAPFDSSPAAQKLALETAAVSHNLNINHTTGLHPILLVKNHLDDFFKRLRKKGFVFQQFSCGEYGSRWARPHFHIILFSDMEISADDIQAAWTIDGYKIGRVDFHDLVQNGSCAIHSKNNNLSQKYVFRYVCKYLMKGNIDFEKLATIDYHKKYFNSLQYAYKNLDSLFPELYKIEDSQTLDQNWLNYCATYSPFVSCSRRPAIGLKYLQGSINRFQTGDFRLFGLSEKNLVFPRYFLRKAKESTCCLVALGKDSKEPASSSRMPFIVSVLEKIYSANLDISHLVGFPAPVWCEDKNAPSYVRYYSPADGSYSFPKTDLSFYDTYNGIYFMFNGFDFTLWQKAKKFYQNIGTMPLNSVICYIHDNIDYYKKTFIDTFHDYRIYNDSCLDQYVWNNYHGDYDEFNKFVYAEYHKELQSLREKQIKINNSHINY